MHSSGVLALFPTKGLTTAIVILILALGNMAISGSADEISGPKVLNISGCCVTRLQGAQLTNAHPKKVKDSASGCSPPPNEVQLKLGDPLAPGQRFWFPHPKAGDHIDFAVPDDDKVEYHDVKCSNRWFACKGAVPILKAASPASKQTNLLIDALKYVGGVALISDEQKIHCCTANRGASQSGEKVLENVDSQINVASLLFDAKPGTYTLQFKSHTVGVLTSATKAFNVVVPTDDPDETNIGPISAGLYIVTINGPTTGLYWIFVANSGRYASAIQALRSAEALTSRWSDQESAHNFLRAYLVALNRQSAAQ
jgi:hypothetical protein